MTTYDDKTQGVIESGGRFILPAFKPCVEATFKASYIVASNVKCDGKITALFDLIVLGNIKATELDIKGRFVCLGNCEVNGSIIVQNEIWANDVRATNIETHDRIVAQEIDGDTIIANGSIVVGKILAVGRLAKSEKYILCGETAYGAGKVSANTIITGEPLDLDDGEEAVVSPSTYSPSEAQPQPSSATAANNEPVDLISYGVTEYAPLGNFKGYLDFLLSSSFDDESKAKFARWRSVISEAEDVVCQVGIDKYINVAMVIWLVEIAYSAYFKNWDKMGDLFNAFENHFKGLVQRDRNGVGCTIGSYKEWLEALAILSHFGASIDGAVYSIAFELVVSNLGLKAKFVSERLYEKGWEAHAE
jgi:hypothetical protein